MSILMPEKGKDFELVPADTHVATCYRLVDLGTQLVNSYGKSKQQHKIMLSWELPNARMQDGRPFTMHQRYTLSSNEKSTLRKHLESWRGLPFSDEEFGTFDIGKLLGKTCLMGVVHEKKDGTVYENISFIGRLPRGMEVPPLVNEKVYFSLNDFDQGIYDKLSDSLKAVIARSPQYGELKGAPNVDRDIPDASHHDVRHDDLNDDIPF